MSQTIITARIVDQAIQLANETLIASGSQGALQIRCEFDSSWNGYGKTAVFYCDPAVVFHVPLVDGLATVPREVLAEAGYFYFGVFGDADNTRTTEVLRFNVAQGAITAATAETEAAAPNIYSQIMAAYGQLDTALQVERARVNELAAMRGTGSGFDFILSDEYIQGTIKSNGYSAYISFTISGLSLIAGGYHYSDYCIPPQLASLCPVDLQSSNPDLNITLEPADEVGLGWSRLLIENPSTGMYTTDMVTTVSGTYPLATPYNSEVGDIRVSYNGDTFETAGEAVRGQTRAAMEAVKKALPAINEKGGLVTCTPVEGLPLGVVSRFESKNLFDISQVPTTEESDTAPYIAEVTENSIKIITKEGYTGNGYVGTATALRVFCPGLKVGDTFTISGTTESKCEYIYLADDYGAALNFGQSYTATEEMLNARVVFYGLHNGTTGNQGVGTCTISNIQIERGTTATAYEPYTLYNGLTLHHTGKNLWDFKSGLSQCRGISASSGADVIRYGYIVKLPPGTYTISGEVLAGTNYLYFNPIDLNTLVMGALTYFITTSGATTTKVTLTEGQGLYFYNANSAATQAASETIFYQNVNIQIEAGNAKTAYEPYSGETKTVTFPAPVSGGIYNWGTGIFEDIYGGGGSLGDPQHIEPFPGVNYLWSSHGETEVNGSAGINGVIEKLTNAIIALGGNI